MIFFVSENSLLGSKNFSFNFVLVLQVLEFPMSNVVCSVLFPGLVSQKWSVTLQIAYCLPQRPCQSYRRRCAVRRDVELMARASCNRPLISKARTRLHQSTPSVGDSPPKSRLTVDSDSNRLGGGGDIGVGTWCRLSVNISDQLLSPFHRVSSSSSRRLGRLGLTQTINQSARKPQNAKP